MRLANAWRISPPARGIADGTGVQDGSVSYRDVLTDQQRQAIGLPGAFVCHMQNASILDVAASPDPDEIHVPPDHGHWPDRHVIAQLDRSANTSRAVDENSGAQARSLVLETVNVFLARGIHAAGMLTLPGFFMHRINCRLKIINLRAHYQ